MQPVHSIDNENEDVLTCCRLEYEMRNQKKEEKELKIANTVCSSKRQ